MPTDPYATPQAITSEVRAPTGPVKAVLIGFAIDVGGSLLLGVLVLFAYGIHLASSGKGTQQEVGVALANISSTPWLSAAGYVVGSALSILGGYVCTRIAQRTDYKLGFILGGISCLAGLLLGYGQYSLPENIALTVLTFACVMVGTRLGIVRP